MVDGRYPVVAADALPGYAPRKTIALLSVAQGGRINAG